MNTHITITVVTDDLSLARSARLPTLTRRTRPLESNGKRRGQSTARSRVTIPLRVGDLETVVDRSDRYAVADQPRPNRSDGTRVRHEEFDPLETQSAVRRRPVIPRVHPDVMMIAAGREKACPRSEHHRDVELQRLRGERSRGLERRHLVVAGDPLAWHEVRAQDGPSTITLDRFGLSAVKRRRGGSDSPETVPRIRYRRI